MKMRTYKIYKHPTLEFFEVVKVGFSWPAFFFSLFWMTNKRLWSHAGCYLVAGIALTRLDKLTTNANSFSLDIFMLVVCLAYLLVPGLMGNRWRDKKLPKQGYKFIASIQAKSRKAAIAQVS